MNQAICRLLLNLIHDASRFSASQIRVTRTGRDVFVASLRGRAVLLAGSDSVSALLGHETPHTL
jgi:hypothetical protein